MPGMSVKEVDALARHVEKQGVTVIRRTDGYLFRLPNGDTCNAHFTSSDVNQWNTIRLLLKRGGITMPGAEEKQIRGTSKRSRSLVRRGLVEMGDPRVVDVRKLRQYVPEPVPDDRTIAGALLTMGYTAEGEPRHRRYIRPNAILGHEVVQPTLSTDPPVATITPNVVPKPAPPRVVDANAVHANRRDAREITVRQSTTCNRCHATITQGDRAMYLPEYPSRMYHLGCWRAILGPIDLAQMKSEGVQEVVVKSAAHNVPIGGKPGPLTRAAAQEAAVPTEQLVGTWTMGDADDEISVNEVIGLTHLPDKIGLRVEIRIYTKGQES
jgi:hypothetical protein